MLVFAHGQVHFIDLREEIICFIQGTPYALRELGRPVEEMKNVGIDGNLLNSLESTLKKDILKELKESVRAFHPPQTTLSNRCMHSLGLILLFTP